MTETSVYLFVEYTWIIALKQEVNQWTDIKVPTVNITQALDSINMKYWKVYKKELAAAINDVMIFHTWRARNWKIFRGITVHKEDVVQHIKKEIIERIEVTRNSHRARRCRSLVQQVLCN